MNCWITREPGVRPEIGPDLEFNFGMESRICRGAVEYQVGEFLGEGLNSQVYRAIRRDPNGHIEQVVAVKILKSQNFVSTWKLELESLARVKSPNCVAVLGWDWILDRPAIVLEYIRGVTLEFALNSRIRFTKIEATDILDQINSGLIDIHRTGICHGDLSPHNIMIDVHGRVCLVDFGLGNITPGEIRCTPGYAHPTLLAGAPPSPATDRFSYEKVREEVLSVVVPESKIASESGSQSDWNPSIRSKIGNKIQSCLSSQKTPCTQKLSSRSHARLLASFSLLPFVLGLGGSQPMKSVVEPAALISVRTQSWALVRVSGLPAQYAPMDRVVEPGNYRVRLETPVGVWERTLTLRPGEHIFIGDTGMRSARRLNETGQGSKP